MVPLDGAAPPSDAYKATVIAGILKRHKKIPFLLENMFKAV